MPLTLAAGTKRIGRRSTRQAPAYANLGGSGDRRALITASTDLTGGTIVPSALVDGVQTAEANFYFWGDGSESLAGKFIKFQFLSPKRITEAKFYFNDGSVPLQGTWQWKGSNNGSDWTDIGSAFTPATSSPATMAELAGNLSGYYYYGLFCVSGAINGIVVPYEFEFKIGNS